MTRPRVAEEHCVTMLALATGVAGCGGSEDRESCACVSLRCDSTRRARANAHSDAPRPGPAAGLAAQDHAQGMEDHPLLGATRLPDPCAVAQLDAAPQRRRRREGAQLSASARLSCATTRRVSPAYAPAGCSLIARSDTSGLPASAPRVTSVEVV